MIVRAGVLATEIVRRPAEGGRSAVPAEAYRLGRPRLVCGARHLWRAPHVVL